MTTLDNINENIINKIKEEKRTQVVIKYYLLVSTILAILVLILIVNRLRLKRQSERILQTKINEINTISLFNRFFNRM